jgi:hypothetical protein
MNLVWQMVGGTKKEDKSEFANRRIGEMAHELIRR